MAQWVSHLWNNIFINPLPLPLSCEICGALYLDLHLDEIQVNFQSWLYVGRNIQLVISFNQGTASLQLYQCIPAGSFG